MDTQGYGIEYEKQRSKESNLNYSTAVKLQQKDRDIFCAYQNCLGDDWFITFNIIQILFAKLLLQRRLTDYTIRMIQVLDVSYRLNGIFYLVVDFCPNFNHSSIRSHYLQTQGSYVTTTITNKCNNTTKILQIDFQIKLRKAHKYCYAPNQKEYI